jgi:hypothetical protein
VPPVTLPVIEIVPVEELNAPMQMTLLPPTTFPCTINVPVEEFSIAPVPATAEPLDAAPPVTFPTIVAVAGETAEKDKQLTLAVVDLFVTFAVKVTPLLRTYVPVPALLNSVQVTFAVMVMTCVVEARASSAAPGTMPPTQVAPALKLPVAAERISAIFYRPFA